MKKLISLVIILCIALSFAACTDDDIPEITPIIVTPEPLPTASPEPETEQGTVRMLVLPISGRILNRGDKVDVNAVIGDYFEISYEGETLYVLSSLIKLDSAEKTDIHIEYAKDKAEIYDNLSLEGEAVLVLEKNDEITVLDELNGVKYVAFGKIMGFISEDDLSKNKISAYYGWGGGDSGGGGGGGGAPAPSGGSDGGDIALGFDPISIKPQIIFLAGEEIESEFVPEPGKVFADNTKAYIALLNLGDNVKVLSKDSSSAQILFNDEIISVPSYAIRLEKESAFEKWDGFGAKSTKIYSDMSLENELDKVKTNDEIQVIDEFDNCYLVVTNGIYGYMDKEDVSVEKVSTWAYSDWGGGGGGGGGGAPAVEWTEPVL